MRSMAILTALAVMVILTLALTGMLVMSAFGVTVQPAFTLALIGWIICWLYLGWMAFTNGVEQTFGMRS